MLRTIWAAGALTTVMFALLSGCQKSQTELQAARVDSLFAPWNKSDSPGCAVGISRNGSVIYQHAYGMANLELNVRNTPDTVFAIASVTKSFTALSALLAAEKGFLSLDDQVQKYIPEWQDREDHITIRHLITHTSGVRDAFALLGWADPSQSAGDINEDIVRILARQHGGNFKPGTEYQYNNGGFNLLASIVKRATGQPVGKFAEENIFKPLGMTHTHYHDDVTMLIPNRASGYTLQANGWTVAKPDGGTIGNAGMYSTVGDLLRYEENFENPIVGTPETIALMQKPIVLKNGTVTTSAMGGGASEYRGVPVYEGSGGDAGIASKIARFPKQHFAVAVACNEDNVADGGRARVNPDVFTNGIADIYLADVLAAVKAPKVTLAPTPVKLSAEELAEKTGLYRIGGMDYPALVSVDHGSLMVRSLYGEDFDLEITPVSRNRFLLQNSFPFEFVPAAPGRTKGWHSGEGKDARDRDLITLSVPAAEIRAYAGDYHSDEIGVTYTLEPGDNALMVTENGTRLAPYAKDVFVGDWLGIVKFSRDVHGVINGLTINRANAIGVRFDRTKGL